MHYTADFETNTHPDHCRVWAWGLCEINEDFQKACGNSIETFMIYAEELSFVKSPTFWFHNLKFDGEFIINYLFREGYDYIKGKTKPYSKSFSTVISDTGQWYVIDIYFNGYNTNKEKHLKIYDSLKVLPFAVDVIAKSFGLPLSKLKINYDEIREEGHELTREERDYLMADIEIPARALYLLFEQGMTKMTTASNALSYYKKIKGKDDFKEDFPIPEYDEFVRKSYKGGFVYANPVFKNKDVGEGIVLDVNSLYPSVMRFRPLPYGEGIAYEGRYKKDKLYPLYVQQIICSFTIKPNHIPTLQLKGNSKFIPTEYVTSSNGDRVTLNLTSVDLMLFLEHYDTNGLIYVRGYKFKASTELFAEYVDHWNEEKIKAGKEGNKGMRTLSKLMLNSLYGKFATSPKIACKNPYLDEGSGIVKYTTEELADREPIYIPVGTFITAWARYITISSAQKCYSRFLYADTDSLHLLGLEEPESIEIDDFKLGAWKKEGVFKRARYLRAKTYIEDMYVENDVSRETFLKVTCAGLPEKLHSQVTWDNFHVGMIYEGKLTYKHVPNGVVLVETDFSIKG